MRIDGDSRERFNLLNLLHYAEDVGRDELMRVFAAEYGFQTGQVVLTPNDGALLSKVMEVEVGKFVDLRELLRELREYFGGKIRNIWLVDTFEVDIDGDDFLNA